MPWICLQFVIVVFPDHTNFPVLRTHLESLGKPRDSTSVLKAMPGKLDIIRHSPSILYFFDTMGWSELLVFFLFFFNFLRHTGITVCNVLIMKLK